MSGSADIESAALVVPQLATATPLGLGFGSGLFCAASPSAPQWQLVPLPSVCAGATVAHSAPLNLQANK